MELPIIIVEFGQQRQRIKLNRLNLNINELVELFSKTFDISVSLTKYEIFLFDKRINSMKNIDFTHLDNYQRFKIQLSSNKIVRQFDSATSNNNDINSLKQRLTKASKELMEVASLINSIHGNYKHLINTLTNKDNYSNNSDKSVNDNSIVPPGFRPLSVIEQKRFDTSSQSSPSTDEGIDRDTGSVSVFESAYSNYDLETIYHECHDDITVINEPNPIISKNNSNLEWRNQPYRPRPYWNSNNKVKYQFNPNKDQMTDKTRLKKPVNPNKAPLAAEKKKNIPCKYAAGGNCKRGSQCRFIHVV